MVAGGCGAQVAGALDRKERLLSQLRSMNDEAEKPGADGLKSCPSESFRQAYADVVMQLKQVPPRPLGTPPHPARAPTPPALYLQGHLCWNSLITNLGICLWVGDLVVVLGTGWQFHMRGHGHL